MLNQSSMKKNTIILCATFITKIMISQELPKQKDSLIESLPNVGSELVRKNSTQSIDGPSVTVGPNLTVVTNTRKNNRLLFTPEKSVLHIREKEKQVKATLTK